MKSKLDLSIVVPAYNEALRITPTLIELDDFLADSEWSYEILVVDDGSKDDTVDVVRALRDERPALRVLAGRPNHGKGYAVRRGMLAARGAMRLMCDADGSMPATEIPKLITILENREADVAIGSRYAPGAQTDRKQPFYRVMWSRFTNAIVRSTIIPGIRDTQCGFKAFTAQAARTLFGQATTNGWSFDIEILGLAHRLGLTIREVGVTWTNDDRSRVNPLAAIMENVGEWIRIRRLLGSRRYSLAPATAGLSTYKQISRRPEANSILIWS